jgi:hypothetical protein
MFDVQQLDQYELGVGPYTHCVWHHSLTEDGVRLNDYASILKYHTNVYGWRTIGYNIIIERDGALGKVVAKWGRPLGMQGAHCSSARRNFNAVGICFVGDYDIDSGETLTQEHFEVAREVILAIECALGTTLIHERHNLHATYKTCPGSAFPFKELINYITAAPLNYKDVSADAWYHDAVLFNIKHRLMVGDGDTFRPDEPMTRAEQAQVNYNLLKALGKV